MWGLGQKWMNSPHNLRAMGRLRPQNYGRYCICPRFWQIEVSASGHSAQMFFWNTRIVHTKSWGHRKRQIRVLPMSWRQHATIQSRPWCESESLKCKKMLKMMRYIETGPLVVKFECWAYQMSVAHYWSRLQGVTCQTLTKARINWGIPEYFGTRIVVCWRCGK